MQLVENLLPSSVTILCARLQTLLWSVGFDVPHRPRTDGQRSFDARETEHRQPGDDFGDLRAQRGHAQSSRKSGENWSWTPS